MVELSIVGGGRGYKNSLLSDREIWTVQGVFPKLGRADKVFRLHEFERKIEEHPGPEYVYFDSIPVDKLRMRFGDYFHSSIAWMYAYAIEIGIKDIAFFGVDMLHESEYGYQRAGLYRMIGMAEMMGIKTYIPSWSGMNIEECLYQYKEYTDGRKDL